MLSCVIEDRTPDSFVGRCMCCRDGWLSELIATRDVLSGLLAPSIVVQCDVCTSALISCTEPRAGEDVQVC